MDADRFDTLARSVNEAISRRTFVGLLAGSAVAGTLASLTSQGVAAKKRKKPCKPCRKRKRGKCRGKQPNGTPCGEDKVCQNGKCISAGDPPTDSCSASNDFCAQAWAKCLGATACGCFMTVEGFPICGNLLNFHGCPATTGCTASSDCDDEEFCVAMPCCPEGKAACLPLCVPPD